MAEERRFSGFHPAVIAGVLAFACAVILTLLVYDRWSRPDVKPPEVAQRTTTGQAAHSAGARCCLPIRNFASSLRLLHRGRCSPPIRIEATLQLLGCGLIKAQP
jgi:hypothetical protein